MPYLWMARPDPKSACTGLVEPMVVTHADELGERDSSTGVFQMLFAGKTVQLPTVGDWANARDAAESISEIADQAGERNARELLY
jgi:hypothetical protein